MWLDRGDNKILVTVLSSEQAVPLRGLGRREVKEGVDRKLKLFVRFN